MASGLVAAIIVAGELAAAHSLEPPLAILHGAEGGEGEGRERASWEVLSAAHARSPCPLPSQRCLQRSLRSDFRTGQFQQHCLSLT